MKRNPSWSQEDDDRLIEIYKGNSILDQLNNFPGRTRGACMRRAYRLRITRVVPWTEEQDALLRDAYAKGIRIKTVAQQIPTRSLSSIKSRCQKLGLVGKFQGKSGSDYSWVRESMLAVLKEGHVLRVAKLAQRVGCTESGVKHVIRALHGTQLHIGDWEHTGHRYVPCWKYGAGEDMPKPAPRSNAESCHRYRIKKRIETKKYDPFATLLGIVQVPTSRQGRVYTQETADELEAA